jgi:itaconyl-CoA hydratase
MSEGRSFGRFLEDFVVGETIEHPLGRTISAVDNAWFTMLTVNTHQIHFNEHYGAQSEFGASLVNSGFTIALVMGLSVVDISQNAIANLGLDKVRLLHPVLAGDTIYARSLVLAVRASQSRPNAGIVTVRTQGLNQDGDVCIVFERSVMIPRRGSSAVISSFPRAKQPIAEDDGS